MISISHWGMFPYIARILLIPAGYRIATGQDVAAECSRPDGMIELVRD
jgi:hypothetical protein